MSANKDDNNNKIPEQTDEFLWDVLIKAVAKSSGKEAEDIKLETPLKELYPDSIRLIECIVDLELKCQLSKFFEVEAVAKFETVNDIYEVLKKLAIR